MKLFLWIFIPGVLLIITFLVLMNRNAAKISVSDCSNSAHIEIYPGDGKEWKCVNGSWQIVDKVGCPNVQLARPPDGKAWSCENGAWILI